MESVKIEVDSLSALEDAAREILVLAGKEKILIFEGAMGAGKTTLIKALALAAGVEETVSSPTFSIVNEYEIVHPAAETSGESSIFHFDFYRIKNLQEAYDIGYEEYFYSGSRCFIEWPEKIETLLPEHYLKISIETLGDTQRRLTVSKI